MAQLFSIHPTNPQLRLLRQAAQIIESGGLAAIPTDSCYALVCRQDDKAAVDRLRMVRRIDERHHLTLLCRDLSDIGTYAKVDNRQYRLLKNGTPGPFTFILEATREVPRRLSHPSRKTIGIRVPDHPVVQGLLDIMAQPLIGTTLLLPGDELPLDDAQDIRRRLEHEIDLVLDAEGCGIEPTTVIDLTGPEMLIVRQGRGIVDLLGV